MNIFAPFLQLVLHPHVYMMEHVFSIKLVPISVPVWLVTLGIAVKAVSTGIAYMLVCLSLEFLSFH